MKRIIPLLLILLIIGVSIYSYINKNKNSIQVIEEETHYGDILIPDNPRLTSVYELKEKKNILKYLDPSEMTNYEDLVTLYVSFLLNSITDEPLMFYETNKEDIKKYLGIYNLDGFVDLNNYLIKNGVTKDSEVDYIKLLELEKEDNLLKLTILIQLNNAKLELSHYINYVYINKMNYLFLYSSVN